GSPAFRSVFPVDRVQGTGDCCLAARARGAAPTGQPTGASGRRSTVFGGGQSNPAPRQVVVIHRHAGDTPALAPATGREALDVPATPRSSANRSRRSCVNRSVGAREPAVGLSANRGRAEGHGRTRVNDHRQDDPPRGTPRTSRRPAGSYMGPVLARS